MQARPVVPTLQAKWVSGLVQRSVYVVFLGPPHDPSLFWYPRRNARALSIPARTSSRLGPPGERATAGAAGDSRRQARSETIRSAKPSNPSRRLQIGRAHV